LLPDKAAKQKNGDFNMAMRAVQIGPHRAAELDQSVYRVLCKALGVGNRNPKAPRIIMDLVLNMPLLVLEKVEQVARRDERMLMAVVLFMIEAYRAEQEERERERERLRRAPSESAIRELDPQ
jgi:hypothetical protein